MDLSIEIDINTFVIKTKKVFQLRWQDILQKLYKTQKSCISLQYEAVKKIYDKLGGIHNYNKLKSVM